MHVDMVITPELMSGVFVGGGGGGDAGGSSGIVADGGRSSSSSSDPMVNGPSSSMQFVLPPRPSAAASGKSQVTSPKAGSIFSMQDTHAASSLPTSMEQLLERQWEQGSQFLMEQGQHFDSKLSTFNRLLY